MSTPERNSLKQALVARLDEKTFVRLAADILAVCHKHTAIQIVDGPGDGGRDISSRTPNGEPHVSQCKFHKNPSKSVSSRETDELPIALLKFGCKHGAFFTTGRASAQAKREYLNSYLSYGLRLYDIDTLASLILDTPVLRMIWLEGKNEKGLKLSAEVPIILRLNASDEVVRRPALADLQHPRFFAAFSFGKVHQARFHPYRPPHEHPRIELCNGKVNCVIASLSGEHLHDLLEPETKTALVHHISRSAERPVTIRLGQLELHSLTDIGGRIVVDNSSCAFVVNQGGEIVSERQWSIFQSNTEWRYPQDLRMLEASWCGWYSTRRNAILMQDAGIPMKHGLSSPAQHMRDLLESQVNISFFLRGSTANCDAFSEALTEALKPDWSCPLGDSDRLLGWLSPGFLYSTDETTSRQFRTDITGVLELEPSVLPPPELFDQKLQEVEALAESAGLKQVDPTDALALSRIEGHALVDDPQIYTADTAELVEQFERLPSPMFHLNEDLTVVTMWRIVEGLLERASPSDIQQGDPAVDVGWSRGEDGTVYLRVSKTWESEPGLSANENVRALERELDEWIAKMHASMTRFCPDAALETGKYYHDVIGLRYSKE